MRKGLSENSRVFPGCPYCPPDFLPDFVLKLTGFFLFPSVDGGLLLLSEFFPSRDLN